jgi:hypothetical protein
MVRLKLKWQSKIKNFKWVSIVIVNIFIQNTQIISFRSFQQILYGGPPSVHATKELYFINQIVCYATLFGVVVSACAGYYILRILIGANINHALDLVKYRFRSMCFMAAVYVSKITNGFVHASFGLQNLTKMSMLMLTQTFLLIAIVFFRRTFKLKTMLALLVVEYGLRVILHALFILRLCFASASKGFTAI